MKHIFMFVLCFVALRANCRPVKNPNLGFNIDTICNDIKTSLSNNEWAEITILYGDDDNEKKKLLWLDKKLRMITDNI